MIFKVSDPEEEFSQIESFLGVESELKFKFNSTKGFYCLERPVPMCLPDSKGRTRSGSQSASTLLSSIPLHKHYEREMRHLKESLSLFPSAKNLESRFSWLNNY